METVNCRVECTLYTAALTFTRLFCIHTPSLPFSISFSSVIDRGQRWSSIHLCIYRGRDGIVYTCVQTGVEMVSIHQYIYRGRDGLVYTCIQTGVEMVQYTPVYIHVQYTLVYRQRVEVVQYTLVYIQGQRWSIIHKYIYMSSIHKFNDRGQRWSSIHQFI